MVFQHLILATISTKLPRPVIPSEVARFFLPRSLLRTSRATQARNLSSIDRASHVGSSLALGNHTNRSLSAPPFHQILPQLFLQTTPAQTPLPLPSIQNRHRPVRQFRAPATTFGLATHRCIATSASRFHNTIVSCPLNFIEPCRPTKLSTHFARRLTRLPICGKLNVYAAWFLRGCSVTGESCPPRPRREATGLSCRYKPKWIQSSYVIFVLLRTSTTANPRSPTDCSK